MLWLKAVGQLWQRFFLEVGAVFWEEWGDEDIFRDFEDLGDHIRPLDELRGLMLGEVEAARFGHAGSGLRIGLGSDGAIWLLPIDPHDAESDAQITVALPSS